MEPPHHFMAGTRLLHSPHKPTHGSRAHKWSHLTTLWLGLDCYTAPINQHLTAEPINGATSSLYGWDRIQANQTQNRWNLNWYNIYHAMYDGYYWAIHMLRSLWCAAQMGHFWGPQSPLICVHFQQNVLRTGSYILSSSLQLAFKQHIFRDYCNQRYLIGVTDTGWIYRVIQLPPEDPCNGWLSMGHDNKFLRHGGYLVISYMTSGNSHRFSDPSESHVAQPERQANACC